jgi:hypothetical protein
MGQGPPALEEFTFEEQLAAAQSIQGGARLHLCSMKTAVPVQAIYNICDCDAVRQQVNLLTGVTWANGAILPAASRTDSSEAAYCSDSWPMVAERNVSHGQLARSARYESMAHGASPVHSHGTECRSLMPCSTVHLALASTLIHVSLRLHQLHQLCSKHMIMARDLSDFV